MDPRRGQLSTMYTHFYLGSPVLGLTKWRAVQASLLRTNVNIRDLTFPTWYLTGLGQPPKKNGASSCGVPPTEYPKRYALCGLGFWIHAHGTRGSGILTKTPGWPNRTHLIAEPETKTCAWVIGGGRSSPGSRPNLAAGAGFPPASVFTEPPGSSRVP